MKQVIIIGAGGHAAELDDYIGYDNHYQNSSNGIQLLGFLDDDEEKYLAYDFSAPFLGKIGEHQVRQDVYYLMGIANLSFRKEIAEHLLSKGAQFTGFVHPDATISRTASIGKGCVIAPNANIGPKAVLGNFNMINSRCSIAHDCVLGDFNFLSPNVCFSGNTRVGDENLFGINAATIPGIQVGSRNKIMAGMILDKNIADDQVVFFRYRERVIAVNK